MYRRRPPSNEIHNINKPFQPLKVAKVLSSAAQNGRVINGSLGNRKISVSVPTEKLVKEGKLDDMINLADQKSSSSDDGCKSFYKAVYRKKSTKKNKSWDGDCVITSSAKRITIKDDKGRIICRGKKRDIAIGEEFSLFGFEFGVEEIIEESPEFKKEPDNSIPLTSDVEVAVVPKPQSKSCIDTNSGLLNFSRNASSHEKNSTSKDAIILSAPKKDLKRTQKDVIIDPMLVSHLRPHQIDGVKFLYECVMGLRDYQGQGALLADEMGLGKTLTTITLVWTLLKQTPYVGEKSIASKILIVCPMSLVRNWQREFSKWLGPERVAIQTVANKFTLKSFASTNIYQVLLIGYDRARLLADELQGIDFDLIVCDEGHRLKSIASKSTRALSTLSTPRRIILTGTPMQNDLTEYYSMVDFLNPGILGTIASFKREYETPIIRARQPHCSAAVKEAGKSVSAKLSSICSPFILRRTANLLKNFLPSKTETIVFCKPTSKQRELYRSFLQSTEFKSWLASSESALHLQAISYLKKLCNSVDLVDKKSHAVLPSTSGKLKFLARMLEQLFALSDEKVVIVSSYVQTLDIIEQILNDLNMPYDRLDGTSNQSKRSSAVDHFNNTPQGQSFAMLLSSKAGGVGLNLIGASRLVLFDTDWNPAIDLQAMARIHRDGQRRPVYIYRVLTTGSIDEKIYQRQVTKMGLADSLMDTGGRNDSSTNAFTFEDLKNLFSIDESTDCGTHDLMECECLKENMDPYNDRESGTDTDEEEPLFKAQCGSTYSGFEKASSITEHSENKQNLKDSMKTLLEFTHLSSDQFNDMDDNILQKVATENQNLVSFVFTRRSS